MRQYETWQVIHPTLPSHSRPKSPFHPYLLVLGMSTTQSHQTFQIQQIRVWSSKLSLISASPSSVSPTFSYLYSPKLHLAPHFLISAGPNSGSPLNSRSQHSQAWFSPTFPDLSTPTPGFPHISLSQQYRAQFTLIVLSEQSQGRVFSTFPYPYTPKPGFFYISWSQNCQALFPQPF